MEAEARSESATVRAAGETRPHAAVPVGGFARALITDANSRKLLGQPWISIRGIASGRGDWAWMKWMDEPSTSARKCLKLR